MHAQTVRKWAQASVCGLAVVLGAPLARAQPGVAAKQAIEDGRQALELFQQGRFVEAHARFEAADKLYHSPVFSLYMARCLANTGKLLRAKRQYSQLVHEPGVEGEPTLWKEARVDAARELDELSARIPSVVAQVKNAPGGLQALRIDGNTVDVSSGAIELDPGAHTVEAVTTSGSSRRISLRLKPGQRAVIVEIDFGREASKSPAPREPGPPIADTTWEPVRWPGFVALGVGAVGIGVGGVTGLLAKRDADAVLDGCDARLNCRPEDEDRAERGRTYGTVSTVSFIVGGAFAAAGTALLLWPPTRERPGSVRITPTVGGLVAHTYF